MYTGKNISGHRFGRLVALEPLNISNRRKHWLCKCDCGNESVVETYALTKGLTKSCGCFRKDWATKHGVKHKDNLKPMDSERAMISVKKTCIEGTRINNLKKTISTNNTSGVKGVYWDKTTHKWRAQIGFKNKKYSLGRFGNKEDAIKVRKQAEEMLFEPFLKWYEEFKNINI